MSGWTLRLRQPPALRLDLRGISPSALAGGDAARRLVGHGNALVALGEFFDAAPRSDGALVFEGDCSRCDHLGSAMDGGTLIVDGDAGDHAGAGLRGGRMIVRGSARELAGCEMAGGSLTIEGSVGDFAAGALPGSMDGMRGGTLVIHGRAGARLGDRMRRGTVLVAGGAGDFLASRMVAGTIALGGPCGAHPAYGMRRGTLVFAGPAPAAPPPTFVRSSAGIEVFWQLLARALARHGGPWAALPARSPTRWRGDLAVQGQGEWIECRP